MEITVMTYAHPLWEKTIAFAEKCSWRAGAFLAGMMRENKFSDIERVLVAHESDNIVGFCTLSEKDSLPEDSEYTPFIGFVFVDENCRGKRVSEKMINEACKYAADIGYKAVYIMSGEHGLYEKYGFEKIGELETIYGDVDQLFMRAL
jgi:predicted N-acetyltransferase YhbS